MESTTLDVNPDDKVTIESAEDLVGVIDEDIETCIGVIDATQQRSEVENMDFAIVVLTDWLTEQKFGAHGTRFVLVNELEDISAKSYLAKGAYNVTANALNGQTSLGDDAEMFSVEVDETDGDYVDDPRTTFLPKSQIEIIAEFS